MIRSFPSERAADTIHLYYELGLEFDLTFVAAVRTMVTRDDQPSEVEVLLLGAENVKGAVYDYASDVEVCLYYVTDAEAELVDGDEELLDVRRDGLREGREAEVLGEGVRHARADGVQSVVLGDGLAFAFARHGDVGGDDRDRADGVREDAEAGPGRTNDELGGLCLRGPGDETAAALALRGTIDGSMSRRGRN